MEKKIPHNNGMTAASLTELRERCKGLNCEQREKLFASALDLTNIEPSDGCLLTILQRCDREERGLDTPIERFICDLLRKFLFRAPDPDDVQKGIEELQLDWNDCLRTARRFYVDHRDLVTAISDNE